MFERVPSIAPMAIIVIMMMMVNRNIRRVVWKGEKATTKEKS